MRFILLTGCLILSPLPALACHNDSNTHEGEEEFRRGYEEEAPEEQQEEGPWATLAAVIGSLGLGGAAAAVLKGGALAAV